MASKVDMVNEPPHYKVGGLECIDIMVIIFGKTAVKWFCICNAFKYIFRHTRKNGAEDIKKARFYLDKWVELNESEKTEMPTSEVGERGN